MTESLQVVGLIAGLGGLAIGVYLLLSRSSGSPLRMRRHLTLFMWLIWSLCVLGMAIYYLNTRTHSSGSQDLAHFTVRLECGSLPPGEDSELAKLIDYAEQHEGELADVDIAFYPNDCSCSAGQSQEPPKRLALVCEHNPDWWLAGRMQDYHCLQALGLAGNLTGVGSVCFPSHNKLPISVGYSREITATHERVSGKFVLNWEWSLGAPQLQLLLPE